MSLESSGLPLAAALTVPLSPSPGRSAPPQILYPFCMTTCECPKARIVQMEHQPRRWWPGGDCTWARQHDDEPNDAGHGALCSARHCRGPGACQRCLHWVSPLSEQSASTPLSDCSHHTLPNHLFSSKPRHTVSTSQKRLARSPQPPAGQIQAAANQPKKIVVKLVANEVFAVDDGPPRGIYDPANTAFLNAISRQELPQGKDGSDATLSLMQVPKDHDPSDSPPCATFPLTPTGFDHNCQRIKPHCNHDGTASNTQKLAFQPVTNCLTQRSAGPALQAQVPRHVHRDLLVAIDANRRMHRDHIRAYCLLAP